jgi:hypothetical protein
MGAVGRGARSRAGAVVRTRKTACEAAQGCDVWRQDAVRQEEPKAALSAADLLLDLAPNVGEAVEVIARGTLAATPTPSRAGVRAQPLVVDEPCTGAAAQDGALQPETNTREGKEREEEKVDQEDKGEAWESASTAAPSSPSESAGLPATPAASEASAPAAAKSVRFDMEACVVHEITPYSEVYGLLPRLFDFDRGFWMVPSKGPPSPAQVNWEEDEDEEADGCSSDEDDYWYEVEELKGPRMATLPATLPAFPVPQLPALPKLAQPPAAPPTCTVTPRPPSVPRKAPAEELCLLLS